MGRNIFIGFWNGLIVWKPGNYTLVIGQECSAQSSSVCKRASRFPGTVPYVPNRRHSRSAFEFSRSILRETNYIRGLMYELKAILADEADLKPWERIKLLAGEQRPIVAIG